MTENLYDEPENIPSSHASSKDDDDPILDFKKIDLNHFQDRKVILGELPFYQATGNELLAWTLRRIEALRESKMPVKEGPQRIMPLDPYRYIWIHNSRRYMHLAQNAFINLPSGAGIGWMSRRLRKPLPETIPVIPFIMNILRLAQAKEYTVFMVGGEDSILEKLFFNLRRSFPRLRIVGRHSGYMKGAARDRVVEALKKTDPHIILLGLGYHKELKWLEEYSDRLGNTIIINVGGSFDILSGKVKKAPDFLTTRGLTWFWRAVNRPWRWHRIFVVFWWLISLFWWKITNRKSG